MTKIYRADTIYRSISKWTGMRLASQVTLGYRAKELAQALGISVATVYGLAKSGRLPFSKVGRSVIFPPRALKAAIKAGYHLKV